MNDLTPPFGGLFRTESRHVARTYDQGFQWDFYEEDLNEAARVLFRRLDEIFDILSAPDFVFLSSIELDAEAGRFPELLVQYFRDDAWADTHSYYVAPMKRLGRDSAYATGRLTFEAAPGQTVRVLAQNSGLRWGSALRVWGLQVPDASIAGAIEMVPDDVGQVRRTESVARAAWLADIDLNSLALWVSPAVGEHQRAKLAALRTA
jgi:hypothetical protein